MRELTIFLPVNENDLASGILVGGWSGSSWQRGAGLVMTALEASALPVSALASWL